MAALYVYDVGPCVKVGFAAQPLRRCKALGAGGALYVRPCESARFVERRVLRDLNRLGAWPLGGKEWFWSTDVWPMLRDVDMGHGWRVYARDQEVSPARRLLWARRARGLRADQACDRAHVQPGARLTPEVLAAFEQGLRMPTGWLRTGSWTPESVAEAA